MKFTNSIFLVLLALSASGQIPNSEFESWRGQEGNFYPTEWFFTDNIPGGIIDKDIRKETNSTVVKINSGTTLCLNYVSQFVDVSHVPDDQKGNLIVVAKVYSSSENPLAIFGIEQSDKENTWYTNDLINIRQNTEGYQEIEVGKVLAETEILYIHMESGGKKSGDFCVEPTTTWIDRVYMKPTSPMSVPNEPYISLSDSGYQIFGIEDDNFVYALYSIDGKLLRKDQTDFKSITLYHNGIYVLHLKSKKTAKSYTFKLVNINY